MEDAIVQFTMTGKASFTDFAMSVIADIQRILIRQALIGTGSSAGGGAIGGLFGAAVGGIKSFFSPAPIPLSEGTNYVPYDGFPATLHKGEAVVPAAYNPANGGSIGGGDINNVTVNISMEAGTTETKSDTNSAAQLGTVISNAVKAELLKQKRSGGLLA